HQGEQYHLVEHSHDVYDLTEKTLNQTLTEQRVTHHDEHAGTDDEGQAVPGNYDLYEGSEDDWTLTRGQRTNQTEWTTFTPQQDHGRDEWLNHETGNEVQGSYVSDESDASTHHSDELTTRGPIDSNGVQPLIETLVGDETEQTTARRVGNHVKGGYTLLYEDSESNSNGTRTLDNGPTHATTIFTQSER